MELPRKSGIGAHFNLNMLKWDGHNTYPVLASYIKGATCKSLLMWAADRTNAAAMRRGASCPWHLKLRATALHSLREFVTVCDVGDTFLTHAQSRQACAAGWLFLRCYQALASAALAEKICLYKVRPKTHYMAHLLLQLATTRENPKCYDLMCAEDFMGRIKRIGRLQHRNTIGQAVIENLSIFYAHRWHRFEHPWNGATIDQIISGTAAYGL